jgi:hypothetical protein
MQTYNIVTENADNRIQEEEGEIIKINNVFIGVAAIVDWDDEDDEYTQYNVTHLESGSLLVRLADTKEQAMELATQKINLTNFDEVICVMSNNLMSIGVEYPVNDITKFKI